MAIVEVEHVANRSIINVDGNLLAIELAQDARKIGVTEVTYDATAKTYHTTQVVGGIDLLSLGEDRHYIQSMGFGGCGGKYLHRGIGRLALKFYRDYFGSKVLASNVNEQGLDDGSQLTGDGPAFIQKMRAEGLVEP